MYDSSLLNNVYVHQIDLYRDIKNDMSRASFLGIVYLNSLPYPLLSQKGSTVCLARTVL